MDGDAGYLPGDHCELPESRVNGMEISTILPPFDGRKTDVWLCPRCETENDLASRVCLICGWRQGVFTNGFTEMARQTEDTRRPAVPRFPYLARHIDMVQFIYGANDADGQWIEEYAPNGRLNYKWWKSGSGKRERQICYDASGAISCFIKYDTMEHPHRERTTWYDSDGDMIRSMETLFDAFGNVVSEHSETR